MVERLLYLQRCCALAVFLKCLPVKPHRLKGTALALLKLALDGRK
jgi:hypothetical protein